MSIQGENEMDPTIELSMTAIEMQFDNIDEFSEPTGMFDAASEIIPQTAMIDNAFKSQSWVDIAFNAPPENAKEVDLGLSDRGRSLPDGFGDDADNDLDHFFDD